MGLYTKNILTPVFIILSHCAISQDSAGITLDFAPSLHLDKFEIIVNDGINRFAFYAKRKKILEWQIICSF